MSPTNNQGWYPPHGGGHMMHSYGYPSYGMQHQMGAPEGYVDHLGMHMDAHAHQQQQPDDDCSTTTTPANNLHRDSYPYHHHWGPPNDQAHATTPRQPPPHMYNGPPVSALVPRDRFPRGTHQHSNMHYHHMHHGYTPYEMDGNRRISFPHQPHYSTYQPPRTNGSTSSKDSSSDRRTSFGSIPGSASNFNFFSTPHHSTNSFPVLDDSSPEDGIPVPPSTANKSSELQHESSPEEGIKQDTPPSEHAPLRNSRRQNLLSTQFEGEAKEKQQNAAADVKQDDDPSANNNINSKPKAASVGEASLLLELATKSNSNSPATIPEPKDKTVDTNITMKKPPAAAALIKSCFPAKVPDSYPTRLSLPNDSIKLNSLHCFVRSELLEIFVVDSANKDHQFRHAPSSSVGRVGLRCVHCAAARKISSNNLDDEAPMAVFYPKAVGEIYRLVTSWQRCHVRKCRSLPPAVRANWEELRRTDKSRGKTAYWATSARAIGMVDCPSRAGGIRFAMPEELLDNSQRADDTENEPVAKLANVNNNNNNEKEPAGTATALSKTGNALQISTTNIDNA